VAEDPHALWEQAGGDRDEYLRLMQEHGHLVPGKRPPGEDIFGHAAWRTPSIGSLDLDTLLYVRESIAGVVSVDRGRPFIDALPLIDEIIRLRRETAEPRDSSPPDLDVERLARAIATEEAVAAQHPEPWRAPVLDSHRGRALMIAAEYARQEEQL
jgi:hypothetical protein